MCLPRLLILSDVQPFTAAIGPSSSAVLSGHLRSEKMFLFAFEQSIKLCRGFMHLEGKGHSRFISATASVMPALGYIYFVYAWYSLLKGGLQISQSHQKIYSNSSYTYANTYKHVQAPTAALEPVTMAIMAISSAAAGPRRWTPKARVRLQKQ